MRNILHADFDAFYASVEQLDNPAIRGKPVVVGGSPEGRGVVASASYEARKYGIRSAMPMRTALQRCPHAIQVNSNFTRYREVSRKVMDIFRELTPTIEPLSMDEAYLDVTERVSARHDAREIAYRLKRHVKAELGLTISVGAAASKSVAKIASDLEKPDGLTVVEPGAERAFLAPLSVGRLWGVGPKTEQRLRAEGIETIGDLTERSDDWLKKMFGRNGPYMKKLGLGEDDRPVQTHRGSKSVSAETTLRQDTGDPEALEELVNRLSHRVARDLDRKGIQGYTVKLKLRLSDFTTFTRQVTLPEPVSASEQIAEAAGVLLIAELEPGRMFRLVGVGLSGFASEEEPEVIQPRLPGF